MHTLEELEAALPEVAGSPADGGTLEMIVARPGEGERAVATSGTFTVADGLVGDNWRVRGSRHTADGRAQLDAQLTVMNRRYLDLIAGGRERWPLAGDQLVVDLDLSVDNLAPGDELAIGSARFVVTPKPHTGCRKFADRFGQDAVRFANSEVGARHRLRGLYVRVVAEGTAGVGDTITVHRHR